MPAIDSAAKTHQQGWLSCQLGKGMFSDEVAVSYPPDGDSTASVFVSMSCIDGNIGEIGRVLVKLIDQGEKTLAVLPSSDQDIVEVRAGDIYQK
tara:strand:+ start:373 stop:654 length:282 start_codon:yes stop_codon:yes gene_type:complete